LTTRSRFKGNVSVIHHLVLEIHSTETSSAKTEKTFPEKTSMQDSLVKERSIENHKSKIEYIFIISIFEF
jgi:hypothetical protein